MKPLNSKTKVKRSPKRGLYDSESIHSILDDDFVCHVGFVHDGYPVVIPTLYGRHNEHLYLHGATSSRMMVGIENKPISVSVTIVDGLVLARSAFHHSMNYRSVVLFGKPEKVSDSEKEYALEMISEHMLAGRWADSRKPNAKELKATTVLKLAIDEASAKVRTGPPSDEREDYKLPIWAGTVPVKRQFSQPIVDESGVKSLPTPPYIEALL